MGVCLTGMHCEKCKEYWNAIWKYIAACIWINYKCDRELMSLTAFYTNQTKLNSDVKRTQGCTESGLWRMELIGLKIPIKRRWSHAHEWADRDSFTKSNVWASKKLWNNYTEKEGWGSKRLEIRSLHTGAAEAGSAVITKTNMQTHVLPRLCMTAVSWLLIVIKSSTWGWSWPGEWSCCGREIIGVIFFALAVPLKRRLRDFKKESETRTFLMTIPS